MVDIEILSGSKGSNPGGKCTLPYRGTVIEAYIKYISNSRLPPSSPFKAVHQPIYEAAIVAMAKKLGLEVPLCFILDNKDGKVRFNYENALEPINRKLDENRPYYFVSKLAKLPADQDETETRERMAKEKFYRDLIMVADVSNKKQNYALIHEDSKPHIFYIDLGCGFVDAVGGILSQRKAVSKLMSKNGKEIPSLGKDLRIATDFLERFGIVTNHKEEYNQDILLMEDFANGVSSLEIPLFPNGSAKLEDLVMWEEVREIDSLFRLNFAKVLREQKRNGSDLIIPR